jgi:LysM repeat protein
VRRFLDRSIDLPLQEKSGMASSSRRRSVMTLALTAGVLATLVAPRASADRKWRVQTGDALSLVAQRFGVTVEQLREWNGLEGDTIYVGQELVVASAEPEGGEPPGGGYVVADGDTLSAIAVRFDVSIDDLAGWNPDLDPDRIQVGQELRVGPARRRVDHRIRRGDSLSRIAHHYGVRVDDLLEWNPRVRRDHVRMGRVIVVYTELPESRSVSVGSPDRGRLEHGVRLRRSPAYVIRDRGRAWATEETATWLFEAFDSVRREHGVSRRARVHDISRRTGGFMSGHVSHQNGRDVDISLYQRVCPGGVCPMRRTSPQELDVARQWTFFEHLLSRNRLEAVFLDYDLQAPLYQQARAAGATRRQLHQWFQYPRGRGFPLGIIRHYPRHRDHAHIRFRCHESDADCR